MPDTTSLRRISVLASLVLTTATPLFGFEFEIVHTFPDYDVETNATYGAAPLGGVVQGTDGHLYGTVLNDNDYWDASDGWGYRLTLAGTYTSFYPNVIRGCMGELVQASDGNFY